MCDVFFPTLFHCGFHVLRSLPFLCQVLIMNNRFNRLRVTTLLQLIAFVLFCIDPIYH